MSKSIETKIIEDYKKYDPEYAKKWGMDIKGNQFMHWDKCAYFDALARSHFNNISEVKVLDMGCGLGHELNRLKEVGFSAKNLYGVDINADRIKKAQSDYPDISFKTISAIETGYDNDSFDIVMLYTVFSSIPDKGLKHKIAQEAARIVKPGGMIVIYDMRYPNPMNSKINPLRLKEVSELFDGLSAACSSITLIPQLARRLTSRTVYNLLHKLPFLRSHAFYIIRK